MNYEIVMKHVNDVRAGDVIMYEGNTRTLSRNDINYSSCMGKSILGDSYSLGHKKVPVVQYKLLSDM